MTDTQIDRISAQLPPTESQLSVDRLMSDIDTLMPTLLNQKKLSSSGSSSAMSTSAGSRMNLPSSHSFFLSHQAKLSTSVSDPSPDVKVAWIDDSTEAERFRQHQLHNLDEMTQIDDDYSN